MRCDFSRYISLTLYFSVLATCPVGDQSGSVKNGLTCSDLVHADPSQCTDRKIRFRCCATCNANKSKCVSNFIIITTTITFIDIG